MIDFIPPEQLRDLIAEELVPLAVELAIGVREHGVEEIDVLLGRIPEGKAEALIVVMAAMIEPDASAKALLGWTDGLLPDATALERARLRKVNVSEPAATLLAEFVTADDHADLDPRFAASIAHLRGQARKDAIKKQVRVQRQRTARAAQRAQSAVADEITGQVRSA